MRAEAASLDAGIEAIKQLTQLVATQGIYALFVIFMFYQQRRARLNLETCKDGDRTYYQRQSTIVLWTTIALCVLVAGVWIYTQFFFQPKVFLEGTIKDITEQPKHPQKVGDPPLLIHRIAPFRDDVSFYSLEKPSLENDSTDLDWVMILPNGHHMAQLVFQKQYCILEGRNSTEVLVATPGQEAIAPKSTEGVIRKIANLDLDKLKSTWGPKSSYCI